MTERSEGTGRHRAARSRAAERSEPAARPRATRRGKRRGQSGDPLPAEVAEVLQAAGWRPDQRDDERARDWGLRLAATAAPDGAQHAFFPAAAEALARFGGLRVEQDGAGEEIARTTFTLDPLRAAPTVHTLAAFGQALGARLFPLGDEADGVAVLAIDETGRVFSLDHTAEWFLGASIEAALVTLVLGRRPARVRVDGTWN